MVQSRGVVVRVILTIITVIVFMGSVFIRCSLCGTFDEWVFMSYLSSLLKASEVGTIPYPFCSAETGAIHVKEVA